MLRHAVAMCAMNDDDWRDIEPDIRVMNAVHELQQRC
jgi:hypothetical protein